MIHCNKRDVILIRFRKIKKRPALVISSTWYNNVRSNLIVLPISSKVPNPSGRDDYMLSKDDIHAGGLLKDSVVKLGKVMTIEKSFVVSVLGHLPESTFNTIIRKLHDVIG